MNSDNKCVFYSLIDARKESGMTQKELAAASGVAQSEISKIERGKKNVTIETLEKLAAGMGCQFAPLFIKKEGTNMEKKKAVFVVDPTDYDGLLEIMEKFGDSKYIYTGHNENNEEVNIHVSHDSIIVDTYQENGWLRRNVYTNDDGDIIKEEMYPERWNK
ncbi:hypothetical protein CJ260_00800 [Megasphaera sp. ASD88]|uniref:helix-turn-helix transcriptional regulator n=1 Tax=Megasphaera sp. ASD88 TaxID=2027407 RepID=UPI000BABCFB2|nr:helix-turn-helix transcriptional regulator [Megasphaera sp. ASD88]PAV40010.1 hypothetical protein CJ260_00800 [Megasphaera sp. ASD88]